MKENAILEQSKKEAKRLFRLAKDNAVDGNLVIPVPNLSSAKDIIAYLNGYPNWKAYSIRHSEALDINNYNNEPDLSYLFVKKDFCQIRERKLSLFSNLPVIHNVGTYELKGSGIKKYLKTKMDYSFVRAQMCTHILALGDSGSGRDAFLSKIVNNQISNNQPVFYFGSDLHKIAEFSFSVFKSGQSLTNQYRFVDFNNPAKSNSLYPFENFLPHNFASLFFNLIDKNPGNEMWKGRYLVLVESIFSFLFDILNLENSIMTVDLLEKAFSFDGFIELCTRYESLADKSEPLRRFINGCPLSISCKHISDIRLDDNASRVVDFLLNIANPLVLWFRNGYDLGYFSNTPSASIDLFIQRKSNLFIHANPLALDSFSYKCISYLLSESLIASLAVKGGVSLESDLSEQVFKSNKDIIPLLVFDSYGRDFDSASERIASASSQFRGLGYSLIYSNSLITNPYVLANASTQLFFKSANKENNEYFNKFIGLKLENNEASVSFKLSDLNLDECYLAYKDPIKVKILSRDIDLRNAVEWFNNFELESMPL